MLYKYIDTNSLAPIAFNGAKNGTTTFFHSWRLAVEAVETPYGGEARPGNPFEPFHSCLKIMWAILLCS